MPDPSEGISDEELEAPEWFVARDQGRDLMADSIDSYMAEGGEFRAYDLADRLTRRLNRGGWWFVHGGDVERLIAQEHPFNVKQADAAEATISDWLAHHGFVDAARFIRNNRPDIDAAEATIAELRGENTELRKALGLRTWVTYEGDDCHGV